MGSEADVALHLDDGSRPTDAQRINRQEARKLSVEPCIQSLVPACHCKDANCTALSCGQDKFVYTCNNCKSDVKTRWHCTVCDDFDLCINCKEKDGHGHLMEKLGFDLDDGSSPADAKEPNPQEARKLSIQRCIQSLVHACRCKDATCGLPGCQKMKRVVQHTKICKRKTNGGCPICKQLIALCCYHAKHCQETKCLVPFCSNIKHKLKQQQLQQRLQQAQLLRRQMAAMNTRPTRAVSAVKPGQPSTSNVAMTAGGALKCGVSPTNLPSPHQSGIGLKPTTQTPPAHERQEPKQLMQQQEHQVHPGMDMSGQMPRQAGVIAGPVGQVPQNQVGPAKKQALQQLMATLRSPSTPEQQGQILQILKSNPPLMAAFMKQREQRSRGQQQQNTSGLQHMMAQQQQHSQQHQQQSTMQILQSQQGQLVGSHGGPNQQHQQQQEQQSEQGQSRGQQVPLTDEMLKIPGVEQETLQESQQPEKDQSSS